jgi:hypothetical protein
MLFWVLNIHVVDFMLVYITVDMMSLFCIHNVFLIRKLRKCIKDAVLSTEM